MNKLNFDSKIHGIAVYLFCRHLEQNKLYNYNKLNDSTNDNSSHKQNNVMNYREIYKVFHRSGAAELLGLEYDELNISNYLVDRNIIVKDGNDISMIDGYWRFKIKEDFGLLDILHEGYYSIDERFFPDKYAN